MPNLHRHQHVAKPKLVIVAATLVFIDSVVATDLGAPLPNAEHYCIQCPSTKKYLTFEASGRVGFSSLCAAENTFLVDTNAAVDQAQPVQLAFSKKYLKADSSTSAQVSWSATPGGTFLGSPIPASMPQPTNWVITGGAHGQTCIRSSYGSSTYKFLVLSSIVQGHANSVQRSSACTTQGWDFVATAASPTTSQPTTTVTTTTTTSGGHFSASNIFSSVTILIIGAAVFVAFIALVVGICVYSSRNKAKHQQQQHRAMAALPVDRLLEGGEEIGRMDSIEAQELITVRVQDKPFEDQLTLVNSVNAHRRSCPRRSQPSASGPATPPPPLPPAARPTPTPTPTLRTDSDIL